MDIVIRDIEYELYFVFGVNADLLLWAEEEKDIFKKAFVERGIDIAKLTKCLGARDPLDRREKCISAIKTLWENSPEFGPYPLLDELDIFEKSGKFYEQYRDHAAHQFMVYILGLFIYSSCKKIYYAVNDEISSKIDTENSKEIDIEEEFTSRWFLAATMHDIGYTLESVADPNIQSEKDEDWLKIREAIEKLLRHGFSQIPSFHMAEVEETRLNSQPLLGWNIDDIQRPENIGEPLGSGSDQFKLEILRQLDPEASASCLGKPGDYPILSRYYFSAHYNSPLSQGRKGFRDHGITSALILLRNSDTFRKKLTDVVTHINQEKTVPKETKKPISEVIGDVSIPEIVKTHIKLPSDETVRAAAASIALHNINKDIWDDHAGLFEQSDLKLKDYCIHLENSGAYNGTALSFLLALTDTLQDWNRPGFCPTIDHDRNHELLDIGISIQQIEESNGGKIGLFFRSDRQFDIEAIKSGEAKDSLYQKMLTRLKAFMQKDAINEIIGLNENMTQKLIIHSSSAHVLKAQESLWTKKKRIGFKLSTDQIEKIKTLTTSYPSTDPEHSRFSFCLKDERKRPTECPLQSLSVLLLAELIKANEALQETTRLLMELGPVMHYYRNMQVLFQSDRHNEDKISRKTARKLCDSIHQFFEGFGGKISLNDRLLARYRGSNFEGYAERFTSNLEELERQLTEFDGDNQSVKFVDWYKVGRNSRLFDELGAQLTNLSNWLDGISKSRTQETREKLRKAFPDAFDELELDSYFKNATETLPHLSFEHLNPWFYEKPNG